MLRVERELKCLVDFTKFDKFYSYWHKWIEDHIEGLTAREFLKAIEISKAMDEFSEEILRDAKEFKETMTDDNDNDNENA